MAWPKRAAPGHASRCTPLTSDQMPFGRRLPAVLPIACVQRRQVCPLPPRANLWRVCLQVERHLRLVHQALGIVEAHAPGGVGRRGMARRRCRWNLHQPCLRRAGPCCIQHSGTHCRGGGARWLQLTALYADACGLASGDLAPAHRPFPCWAHLAPRPTPPRRPPAPRRPARWHARQWAAGPPAPPQPRRGWRPAP